MMARTWIAAALVAAMNCSTAAAQVQDTAGAAWAQAPHRMAMAPDAHATLLMFTELVNGGIQRAVGRQPDDEATVRLVRTHLRDIRDRFVRGGLAEPGHDGGASAPARLAHAAPGSVLVGYRDIPGGGELTFQTREAALVAALHDWFNAQASVEEANAVVAHLHDRGPSGSR